MSEQKQDVRETRRRRPEQSWAEKDEKYEEKEEKDEKGRDEKWRRDPVASVTWAAILIWIGLVLLADNLNLVVGTRWNSWAIGFTGAGVIVIAQALIRLTMPEYRRGVMGGIICGVILLGIGLGWLVGWGIFWPLLLIAIGLLVLWRAFSRR